MEPGQDHALAGHQASLERVVNHPAAIIHMATAEATVATDM